MVGARISARAIVIASGAKYRKLAVQGQAYGPMFDEKLTVAARKHKRTWAIVSENDRMLPVGMEAGAAKRMREATTEFRDALFKLPRRLQVCAYVTT